MGSFWEYFSLLRASWIFFLLLWLEGISSSCPRALFRFFTQSLGHSVQTSCHPNCFLKLIYLSLFLLMKKGVTSSFRILANHLASFFFLHPVRRFVQTTISFTRVRLRGTDSLTYILYFLRQAGWSWPAFLIPLLTVSLWWAC